MSASTVIRQTSEWIRDCTLTLPPYGPEALERVADLHDEAIAALKACKPSECMTWHPAHPEFNGGRLCGKCGYCLARAVLEKAAIMDGFPGRATSRWLAGER